MNNEDLAQKKCVPCEGGVDPMKPDEVAKYLIVLKNQWKVIADKKITYTFKFKNFVEAMKFVNEIARIAEKEGHHPDITIHYNRVVIELWTHAIGGLSMNDFILASKIERI